MDQAMAATLAAISIPTPPSKTGNLIFIFAGCWLILSCHQYFDITNYIIILPDITIVNYTEKRCVVEIPW
jgi:hypothetical protein